MLDPDFFERDVVEAARDLIGVSLSSTASAA